MIHSQLKNSLLILSLVFTSFSLINAQNAYRYYTDNNIGWITYNGMHKIAKKWDIATEYQFRRSEWGAKWMQSLLRFGVQYRMNDKVSVLAGYSFIETFPYGDLTKPLNPSFKTNQSFPEHRSFAQVVIKDAVGRLAITNRFRLEQRWIGTMDSTKTVKDWTYTNRMRYLLRVDCPLQGKTLDDKEFYVAAYDEVMLNFGDKVKSNIFDQNRFSVLVGFKINKQCKIEAGYIQQLLQQGGTISNATTPDQAVMQINNGYIVNLYYNFDFTTLLKKKEQPTN
jgi:Protein of unknown function (DUF2490)